MLSKDQLFGRVVKTKEVELDIGSVLIRELTVEEAKEISRLQRNGKHDDVAVYMVRTAVCNADGTAMFDAQDDAKIRAMPLPVFVKLVKEIEAYSEAVSAGNR
jgi:hypothetical protein